MFSCFARRNLQKGGFLLRIAIFTDTYFPQVNGVAKTLKKYTDYLERKGFEFEVFAPEVDGASLYPRVHQFKSIPFFLYPECRTAFAHPSTILERLQTFSPDIIHVTTPLSMGLLGIHAAKRLNIPIVSSYHTHFDQYLEYYKLGWISPLLWRYIKWFYESSERIFAPSQETMRLLHTKGFSNVSLWSRGVDCTLFHPLNQTVNVREKHNIVEPFILLYVGRLAPEKDLSVLINIIEHFPQEWNSSIHWLIVGDGPSYHEVSEIVESKGNVTMTGYLSGNELASCYAVADVFIFPSQTETFGNVVLEALASGTPPVVSNRGGVAEIVKHEKTGMVCEAAQDEIFISHILQLLKDEDSRSLMAKNGREYALMQTWDQIFEQLVLECQFVVQMHADRKTKLA